MRLLQEVYEHPSQASRIRINVYDYQPESTVAGMGPREAGYLVDFVKQVSQICRGKAYFTNTMSLGQFILMDFMKRKTRHLR